MIRRNLDTDLLRSFVTAVDRGGFTQAGAVLGRTQSAISMQMKRLEEATGSTLFQRDGRKMRLTPQGELLLGYARQMIVTHDQALDALQDSRLSGAVSLAVMGDYATHVLPGILADFAALHPDIKLDITTGFSADLLTRLGDRFELVLATQPQGTRDGQILRSERTRWAYSSRHDFRRRNVPEEGGKGEGGDILPLAVLPPGNLFREWALRALDRAGIHWRICFTSTSIAAVEAAAAAGIAVAVVKEGTATDGLRFLDASDGLPDLPSSDIVLYRAPGKHSKAADALADHLVTAITPYG